MSDTKPRRSSADLIFDFRENTDGKDDIDARIIDAEVIESQTTKRSY